VTLLRGVSQWVYHNWGHTASEHGPSFGLCWTSTARDVSWCDQPTVKNETSFEVRHCNSYQWASGGVLGFDSRRGLGIFFFTTASRTALGPTQPPFQGVPGALSLKGKATGEWSWPSPPSSAEVKEWVELYLHSPNTPSWRGAQLNHRDNFTFYTLEDKYQHHLQRLGPNTVYSVSICKILLILKSNLHSDYVKNLFISSVVFPVLQILYYIWKSFLGFPVLPLFAGSHSFVRWTNSCDNMSQATLSSYLHFEPRHVSNIHTPFTYF
jgi:hypothetical protein